MPKRVVTIHGIDTVGSWQEEVERVLTPHFECVHIKYPDYQHFEAVRLVFGSVWLLFLAVTALALCVAGLVLGNEAVVIAALGCLLLAAILTFLVARRKRSLVLNRFKAELETRAPLGDPPHLVAHSGTFLAANVLLRFPKKSSFARPDSRGRLSAGEHG
jgi:hypothetical protein